MKLENEFNYPLELFVQGGSDGHRATLRSNSGAASIYFWFTAEQARAAAQAFLDIAVELDSEAEGLKSSAELVKELSIAKVSGLVGSTIGHEPSQDT